MKIINIYKSEEKSHTYDIEVKEVHEFLLGNGLVSHNSSLISNSTNGIEPPLQFLQFKSDKKSSKLVIAPHPKPGTSAKWHKNYQYAFDINNNEAILRMAAAQVKFLDMASSINTYYDFSTYEDNALPLSQLQDELVYTYICGIPTQYYMKTKNIKQSTVEEVEESIPEIPEDFDSCASGACSL